MDGTTPSKPFDNYRPHMGLNLGYQVRMMAEDFLGQSDNGIAIREIFLVQRLRQSPHGYY